MNNGSSWTILVHIDLPHYRKDGSIENPTRYSAPIMGGNSMQMDYVYEFRKQHPKLKRQQDHPRNHVLRRIQYMLKKMLYGFGLG
jgi:hypothetical protein